MISSRNNIDNEVDVEYKASKVDDDTTLITMADRYKRQVEEAVYNFENSGHNFSKYLTDDSSNFQETNEKELKRLGESPQDDIDKVKRINEIARYYINTNDLVGKVYETIQNNVNINVKLDWPVIDGRNKEKKKIKAQNISNKFLENINVEELLKKVIPLAFSEGNYFMYLRNSGDNINYTVDHYDLDLIDVSDYSLDGEDLCVFDVDKLRIALQRNSNKYRKRNGENLFGISDVEAEVKRNYPSEIYEAYMARESYALLDINYSGLLKINDLGKKYGVTPLFRAFKPLLILDIYDYSNLKTAKTRAKKILVQGLSDKLLEENVNDNDTGNFQALAYAHNNLMKAFKNSKEMVIATTPPTVDRVYFVESNTQQIDINLINNQRDKILTALGISFLANESKSSFNTVEVGIDELRRQINTISLQLSKILEKWVRVVLRDNHISPEFAPHVTVESSAMLDMDTKRQLMDDMFNKYGAPYRTVYETLGFDYETEKERREQENDEKLDTDVFYGRANGYTTSSKDVITDNTNQDTNTNNNNQNNDDNKNVDKKKYDKDRHDNEV